MEASVSASASTVRSLHHNLAELSAQQSSASISLPSSPRSSALPSPPDSPSESVSSLPSVSSSFFFSSAAASPPHSHSHSDHARDSTQGLIIPSLTLPSALRRPTAYGQTLGDLRLLVLGSRGAGKSFLSGMLLDDNEDVVEVGTWEEAEYGRVLRASTDWVEHRDAHGLEKFEPSRNVEIIELPGYDHNDDAQNLIQSLKSIIHSPFYAISDVLDPKRQPSAVLANLVSSPNTPLYTALIYLLPLTPSPLEQLLIDNLGPQIPIIVLPRLSTHHRHPSAPKLSSFRPSSAIALRAGLFHSPETLSTLRSEAADRFLRWREVERVVDAIHMSRREDQANLAEQGRDHGHAGDAGSWDKAKWEAEWESSLSVDVARRLRQGTLTERNVRYFGHERDHDYSAPRIGNSAFDPLHLPSLFMFSLSLLGPLQSRLGSSISAFMGSLGDNNVKAALLGGFCVGLGVGLFLR